MQVDTGEFRALRDEVARLAEAVNATASAMHHAFEAGRAHERAQLQQRGRHRAPARRAASRHLRAVDGGAS